MRTCHPVILIKRKFDDDGMVLGDPRIVTHRGVVKIDRK